MANYDDEEFENFNVDDLAAEIEKEDSGVAQPEIQIKGMREVKKEEPKVEPEVQSQESNQPVEKKEVKGSLSHPVFALKCTANREDTVAEFLAANAKRKGLNVYSVIIPHGIKNFIFVEASDKYEVDQAAYRVPYARNVLPTPISEKEALQLISTDKKEVDIRKNDIVEIVAGPFKKEQAKITRVDLFKEEVVIELLDAAVPIPMTRRIEDVRVIRREDE